MTPTATIPTSATDSADPAGACCDDPDGPEPPSSAGIDLQLRLETPDVSPPLEGWLEQLYGRVLGLLGVTEGTIGLTIVGDAEMARLHGDYRGEPTTTDVLSFDLRSDPADPIEGDIVVCLDEAARQAERRGIETRQEVLLYAVHGLLHWLGHDDTTPELAARMHAKEDELLTAIGVGPVYGLAERDENR